MTNPDSPISVSAERAAWAGISDTEAKRIANEAVQYLADSEPNDDTIEAQDRLQGTPQESLFCVSANVLEQAIYTVIANATYDASHYSPAADRPVENSELREALNDLRNADACYKTNCGMCRTLGDTAAKRIEELFASLQQEAERRFQSMMEAHKANGELALMLADKDEEIKARGELYGRMCETLHACCQKYKLGLGGEHVDELVVAEISRLRVDRITKEEAQRLLRWVDYYSLDGEKMFGDMASVITALRRLSSEGNPK